MRFRREVALNPEPVTATSRRLEFFPVSRAAQADERAPDGAIQPSC
jgi:hypothetical protein